jgi:hypothetical protein
MFGATDKVAVPVLASTNVYTHVIVNFRKNMAVILTR